MKGRELLEFLQSLERDECDVDIIVQVEDGTKKEYTVQSVDLIKSFDPDICKSAFDSEKIIKLIC